MSSGKRADQATSALENLGDVLATLDRHVGPRFSIRQAMALVSIMRAEREERRQPLSHLQLDVPGVPYRSIAALRDWGLITLTKSPHDQRNTLTGLTRAGRDLAQEVVAIQRREAA